MVYGDNPSDPLGLNAYTYKPDIHAITQSGNLYVYGLNNPLKYQDPSGKSITVAVSLTALGIAFLALLTIELLKDPNFNRAVNTAITQISSDIDKVAKKIGQSFDQISSYLVNEVSKKQQKIEARNGLAGGAANPEPPDDDGRSNNNQVQNKQADNAAREANLSDKGKLELHKRLQKEPTGNYQKVLDIAREIARLGGSYVN